jgi:hypothetical protein
MSVLITRLITGEEILGDVTPDSGINDLVNITNPVHIAAVSNPNTKSVDIHMAPFIPLSSQKTITVSLRNVLCQYEPVVEILNKYNTTFGSGIIIPNSTGLTTA